MIISRIYDKYIWEKIYNTLVLSKSIQKHISTPRINLIIIDEMTLTLVSPEG